MRVAHIKMCAKRTSRARSAKSLAAGVQGPPKGPGSSGVLDALWCNLSPILEHLNLFFSVVFRVELRFEKIIAKIFS